MPYCPPALSVTGTWELGGVVGVEAHGNGSGSGSGLLLSENLLGQ